MATPTKHNRTMYISCGINCMLTASYTGWITCPAGFPLIWHLWTCSYKGSVHRALAWLANTDSSWGMSLSVKYVWRSQSKTTVYPKKYAQGFCFAVLCCGYTLTDFPISIRLTSLALWQSNDCPSASKATLMNMDKYFMWIHYERLHNHNKAKHNKTVCIFLGIYCISAVCQ